MSNRTPEQIAEAVESLRQYGGRVHAQVLDVHDEKARALEGLEATAAPAVGTWP